MAHIYADEQFPRAVVENLRLRGHDILTVQEAGKDNQKIPDEEVLAFAISKNRAVLTLNRRHFIRLHSLQPDHAGIIVCKGGGDLEKLANNINDAIYTAGTLTGKLIRVYRLPPHSTSN